MERRNRMVVAVVVVVALFLVVQLGALALVPSFDEAGRQQFENPEDPTNTAVFVVLIVVMTAGMLAAFRYDLDVLIRAIFILVTATLSWQVFSVVVPPALGWSAGTVALVPSVAVAVALAVYPEWYVVDVTGVLIGAAAAGLFGISLGIAPVLLLLVVLAVYDAISVYGTEHMLSLAEGVLDLNVPVVLVVPTTRDFSFLDPPESAVDAADAPSSEPAGAALDRAGDGSGGAASNGAGGQRDEAGDGSGPADSRADDVDAGDGSGATEGSPLERGAIFVGLGDAVMPAILVASAANFLEPAGDPIAALNLPLVVLNVPALSAMLGTLAGLLVLMWLVMRGRAHAGLPLLNGGAIAGYLAGAVAVGVPLATAIGL